MAQNHSQTPISVVDPPAAPNAAYRHPGLAGQNYSIGQIQEQHPTSLYHNDRRQYLQAIPIQGLGPSPAPVDCPICGQRGMTITHYEFGETTHLWAVIACFLVCLGCIPYLMTSLQDVHHKCGYCSTSLAIWHRSGEVNVLVYRMA